jgi:hypothetical protein
MPAILRAPVHHGVRPWAITAAILILIGTLAATWPHTEPAADPIRLFHTAPPDTTMTSGGVLAPDGRQIAFVARGRESGMAQLWVRALDTGEARAIPGTERAARPFWSPDSASIAFFSDGKLRRLDLQPRGVVQPPTIITTVGYAPAGGSWGTSGEILFATRTSQVQAVPAGGGTPRPVTAFDAAAGEVAHRWPQFLPDGRHFLYVAEGTAPRASTTFAASLDGAPRVALLDNLGSPAFFAAPNYLLYVRDRVLMAQRFDLKTFTLDGAPVAITSNVAFPTLTNGGVVSAARGLLAIWGGPADHRLVWFDRRGERLGAVDAPTALHNPELSADDRLLIAQGDGERPGIWLVDLERGAPMNIAREGMAPTWSPDGGGIAFMTATPKGRHLRVQRVGTRESPDRVVDVGNAIVADWSLDGRHLLYSVEGTGNSRDVWVLPMDEEEAARPYLHSPANEVQSRMAPGGDWVAYASDESGTWEVYLDSFPSPGIRRVISVGGGAEPQWRRDGKELFYVAPDGTMMAVDVTPGEQLTVGRPKPLFRAPLSGDISSYRNRYAVTTDGERFLIDATDRPELPPLEVIVNWTALLNR